MFDLEQSIAEWRRQMRAADIKTAVPLDELEAHLREDFDRLKQSGLSAQTAFETAARQLGQPQTLKTEFKKNGTALGKKLGTVALITAAFLILNVLYVHGHTGYVWVLFPVVAINVLSWSASTMFFDFSLGEVREMRLWKLAALTYSTIGVWVSLMPVGELVMNHTRFAAGFGTTDRLLTMVAVAVSILSIFAWRLGSGVLPVVSSQWTRTLIGIVCCLSGPAAIALTFYLAALQLGHVPAPLFFVLWSWTWTFMAILAGTGYGLAEAARRQTTATTS